MRAPITLMLAALMAGALSPAMAAPAHKPAAGAQGDATTSDVRCLLTMAAIGQDKNRQQAALIGVYFFAGRLSARAPGLDLQTAVKAQEAKMSPQELPAEAQRCGPMVQAYVLALQRSFAPPPSSAQPAQPSTPSAPSAPSTPPAPATPAPPR